MTASSNPPFTIAREGVNFICEKGVKSVDNLQQEDGVFNIRARSHLPDRAEAALQEIGRNKGILYDEEIVDACLRLFREKDTKLGVGVCE